MDGLRLSSRYLMLCVIWSVPRQKCDSEEEEGRVGCFCTACASAGPGAENKIAENQDKKMNFLSRLQP